MKVSPELVGRLVAIQLARPLYIIDYAAHVKQGSVERLVGKPAMSKNDKGEGPILMEILPGCDVLEVTEDSIKFALDINGNITHVTIPSALVVAISEVVEFESEKTMTVTERIRAPKSKLIVP